VKRHIGIAGMTAVASWLVVASTIDAKSTAADWARPRVLTTSTGITAVYPRAWNAAVKGSGVEIASRPFIARRRVYIWLASYGQMPKATGFVPRPQHFELEANDFGFQSCGFGFEGWNLTFVDHGITVQAVIRLARDASRADVTSLLDRLQIRTRAAVAA
jgi:hypothetical protein